MNYINHVVYYIPSAHLSFNLRAVVTIHSGPITSWEIDGETGETVSDFIFLGSKNTADGD